MIVASLVAFCDEHLLSYQCVRVWMCCLCVNQWRVREMADKQQSVPFNEFQVRLACTAQHLPLSVHHAASRAVWWRLLTC
jgi:hypothetical protein